MQIPKSSEVPSASQAIFHSDPLIHPATASPTGLTQLEPDELFSRTLKLAETERRITVAILRHLQEIDRRRAYAKRGHASLWDYVTRELKYSESAAYRRISAMRALQDHPELESKLQSGKLSVTTVSQVQSFVQAERFQANRKYNSEQKSEIFERCENKTTREVTRELLSVSPTALLRVQKERCLTENRTLISFIADDSLLNKLHRVRDLSAARLKDPASYPELVDLMSTLTLKQIDPLQRLQKNQTESPPSQLPAANQCQNALPAPQPTLSVSYSRYIPAAIKREVWKRDQGQCTYVSRETQKRCESRFGLEIEHCKPLALGGSSSDLQNLRLLCRAHNQLQAIQSYGQAKMEQFLVGKKQS